MPTGRNVFKTGLQSDVNNLNCLPILKNSQKHRLCYHSKDKLGWIQNSLLKLGPKISTFYSVMNASEKEISASDGSSSLFVSREFYEKSNGASVLLCSRVFCFKFFAFIFYPHCNSTFHF